MHAGTNLGPPFNRSASNLTPFKTLAPWFFSPSCHCSHACSSFSFSSVLFLSLFYFLLVYPALFHSHLTTLAPLQSTHPHHSLCCFLSFPPHILSPHFLPLLPAPVSQVSACLFPSLAHFFIFSATRFLSLPLFVGFLSLLAPMTPSPATVSISLFPTASLSSPLIPCLSTQ